MTVNPAKGSLTLVVVAYHRPEVLDQMLVSAAGQAARVVVVNVDDDVAVTEVARRRGAETVPVLGNPGYAAAVNRGVAAVRTPLVAFANDDLELAPGCLPSLAAALGSGADVAVPRLCRPDGAIEPSIARLVSPAALAGEWLLLPDNPPTMIPSRVRSVLRVQKWRRPLEPEWIESAEAALVLTLTDLLRRSPLPEAYFLYWEEHEWFHELRRSGRSVMYVPTAVATHGGWGELSPVKARLLARNAVRCLARSQGRLSAAQGWPVVVLWCGRLWLVDALRVLLRRSVSTRARLASRSAGLASAVGAWREVIRPGAGRDISRPRAPGG